MLPQRWTWARLLSPTPLALLKWQLLRNSPAATAISKPTCAVPLRRFDCLPYLKTGESRIVVTNRQDVCDVQVEKGAVVCKVASAGDVCSVCEKEVKGKPILYMSAEQTDSHYSVCWPCSSTLPRPNADLIVNRAVSHRVLLTVPFQFVDHSHSDVMPTANEDFSGVWPHLHICNGIDAIPRSVLLACTPA